MSAADLFDLTGKVALVTGGSRGLGLEMVRAFAAAGADVVVTSRKLDACEALVAGAPAHGADEQGFVPVARAVHRPSRHAAIVGRHRGAGTAFCESVSPF